MKKEMQKFLVSQAAIWIKDGKCLLLESAYSPGFWGLFGGRIDVGESADIAFARELKEELNLEQFKKLGLVDYLVFYDVPSGKDLQNPICAIINLIQSDKNFVMSDMKEHLSYVWIAEDEIDNYKYVWYGLDKSIKKAFLIYNQLNK